MGGVRTAERDERAQFAVGEGMLPVAADVAAPVPWRPPSLPGSLLRSIQLRQAGAALRSAYAYEVDLGNTFLFVPVFIAAGALAYFSWPHEPSFSPILIALTLLLVSARFLWEHPILRALCLACAMTLLGAAAGKFETWRAGTQMLGSEITTRLTGRVARIEHQESGRIRLTLDVMGTARPQLRYAPDRVRVTARSVPEGLRIGAVVTGATRLMPASGPIRPQSYDFSFKSYFDGIGAVGFFLTNPELVETEEMPSRLDSVWLWIEELRSDMASRISQTIGGPEGYIAAALITGIRAGIPEEINDALRVVGLYHVISISGLHMALVGGTLLFGIRGAFALAPTFSARHPVKKYAAFAALLATAFYLLISGGDVAAQRSFLMLAVMLIAVMMDRAALTMRNLAISAVIILLLTPHEVVGPSFQMSFAATAALVAAYAAWTQYREGRPTAVPARQSLPMAALRASGKYAFGMSMTSIVAGLATALFTAWHFQQVAPLGLVANLAAMPFVSVIVMPMAVIASLLMPLGLDGFPLIAMGMGIAAMNAIALWLAQYSMLDTTGVIPLDAVLVLTAALAILMMATGPLRWASTPLLAAGLVLLAQRQGPDIIVSEDARLVALRLSDGPLAVNRNRPRAFTVENWMRAAHTKELVRPTRGLSSKASAGREAFSCEGDICVAAHGERAIVHATMADAAASYCAEAILIVIDDATAENPCAGERVTVLTKRDLARRGSAEIRIDASGAAPEIARIDYAISEPYRPWHAHRQFSREARGLAPYRRPAADERRSRQETADANSDG